MSDLAVSFGQRTVSCEWALEKSQLMRGIIRPTIEFRFPDGAITLDSLRALIEDKDNTDIIVITNNETGVSETLEHYTIKSENCISLKTMIVEEATYDHPAVYADKIVLELGLAFSWEN